MKLVNENINFKRGQDPHTALGIGGLRCPNADCQSPNIRTKDAGGLYHYGSLQEAKSDNYRYKFDDELNAEWICDNCGKTGHATGKISWEI